MRKFEEVEDLDGRLARFVESGLGRFEDAETVGEEEELDVVFLFADDEFRGALLHDDSSALHQIVHLKSWELKKLKRKNTGVLGYFS